MTLRVTVVSTGFAYTMHEVSTRANGQEANVERVACQAAEIDELLAQLELDNGGLSIRVLPNRREWRIGDRVQIIVHSVPIRLTQTPPRGSVRL